MASLIRMKLALGLMLLLAACSGGDPPGALPERPGG